MNLILVLPSYLRWHYSRAVADLLGIWEDFIHFVYHFFSIPLLTINLFSPWERMGDSHTKGESLEQMFGTVILNTIMRGVGFVVRGLFIVVGIIGIGVVIAVGLLMLCVWLTLPILVVYALMYGIHGLFS